MPNIRKPNKLHEISGTYRKDRHGEKGKSLDDRDLGDLPGPPEYLNGIARGEWHRVVELLGPHGLLKGTDYGVLIAYCQLFSALAASDVTDIKASLYTQFRGYCNDLGLTPVSRSKINLGVKSSDDDNPYNSF